MNVFITGITGLIGSQLAKHLDSRGMSVSGSVRSQASKSGLEGAWQLCCIELADRVEEGVFEGQDAIIHCAYDRRPGTMEENIEGTLRLSRAAARVGVPYQIFVSSCSARPEAQSEYGRLKFELEKHFLSNQLTVIRCGLVIGPGGLFLRMAQLVRRWPLLPLPDGGRTAVPVLGIDDLAGCAEILLRDRRRGLFQLFNRHSPTLRQLLGALKKETGSWTLLLPLPSALLALPLKAARWAALNLPVSLDNLKGYQQAQGQQSDLMALLERETPLGEMIRRALHP